jgi:hypothetical protein
MQQPPLSQANPLLMTSSLQAVQLLQKQTLKILLTLHPNHQKACLLKIC